MDIIINGTIYSLTYPIDMIYVGLTTRTAEIREGEHIRNSRWDKPPTKISRAMKEYGHKKFKLKILRTGITDWQLLNELEIEEIAKHNSCDRGYNCDKGGLPGFRFAKIWEHREEIEYMHETQVISATKIAEHFGVGEGRIYKILDRLRIQRRNAGYYLKGKPSPRRHKVRESEDEIYRLFIEEYMTIKKIAEKYNCNRSLISRIIRSMGIDTQGKHPAWQHKEEIARLYDVECMTMGQIAERYRCDQSVISDILKDMGIEIRDGKNPVWKHEKEIDRFYNEDLLSANQIADLYACSVYLIQDILKSRSIILRNPREAQLISLEREKWKHQPKIPFP